jgi:hypothetical protein
MDVFSTEAALNQLKRQKLDATGYAIIPSVIAPAILDELIHELTQLSASEVAFQQGNRSQGIRNLLKLSPVVRQLATNPGLKSLVTSVLGPGAKVVRSIFFNKTPEANWNLPFHQDLTIAVQQKHRLTGYDGWSQKAGITHVQPPVALLDNILITRLHLDNTDADNGALRVIPGSHHYGRLSDAEIQAWRDQQPEEICCSPRGGVLLMRPLLLHASSKFAEKSSHVQRRVIHLEWSAQALPPGLAWYGS